MTDDAGDHGNDCDLCGESDRAICGHGLNDIACIECGEGFKPSFGDRGRCADCWGEEERAR